jgi:hypothetical protein
MIMEVIGRTPHKVSLSVRAQSELAQYWYNKTEVTAEIAGLTVAYRDWETTLKHYRKLLMMLGEELMYALHIKEGGAE